MLTCVLQNFLEHFSNSRSYLVIPLKYFFCKLLAGSRTLYKYIYIKTPLCSSRSCCRSDDCFESYTEKELLRKIACFKELWRQK